MISLYLVIYQEGNRMYLIKSCQCVPCLTLLISLIRRIPKAIKTMLSPEGCGMKTSSPVFLQPRYLKGENVTIGLCSESLIEAQCPLVPANWDLTLAPVVRNQGLSVEHCYGGWCVPGLDCSHSSFFQMWLHILPARWVDSSPRRTPVTHKMPSKALAHSGSL